MTTARAPRTASQRLFGALLSLLAVLLPGLVAGVQIGRAPTDAEVERLRASVALREAPQPAALAAHVLYPATLHEADRARLQAGQDVGSIVVRARLSMLWLMFAIGGLFYLLLSVTRGGLTAVFGCLFLSSLPPVVDDGCVLRPEPLACAFGLLATVLLATYALTVMVRRRGPRPARALLLVVVAALTGAAYAVAAAALSRASLLLLVPAAFVTLAAVVQAWRWVRVLRRGRRIGRGMLVALARRSWPWFCLGAVGMAASSLVLYALDAHGVARTLPTASAFGYLPASWPRAALLGLLMVVGGLRLLFHGGAHVSGRRLHPSLVLLLLCTLALMQFAHNGAGINALLPACAAAALAGEGATFVLVLFIGTLLVHARQGDAAAE
ncbi:MAG: hypothetical protein R3F56_17715 [Planctomycetota bacterium]